MEGKEDVKLFGMWASPFTLRVAMTLKLKGIGYDYIEEDLNNKSPQLLQYNPVYKKVPILVHAGKPILESLVIIEYIEETWKQNPILPEDPYERAEARFWVRFAEEKCLPPIFNIFRTLGEEREKNLKGIVENLKILEKGFLEGKKFFGGEKVGFMDISNAWIPRHIRVIEEIVGVSLVEEQSFPLLNAWFADILDFPVVKETLPPLDKFRALCEGYNQRLLESSN